MTSTCVQAVDNMHVHVYGLCMTTEPQYKSLRVTVETHRQLYRLMEHVKAGSVDETIAFLLGLSAIRVPVTDTQRERWEAAAERAGQTLAAFVEARVEGSIAYGGDQDGLQLIFEHVQALTAAAGVKPIPVGTRPVSTPRAHP